MNKLYYENQYEKNFTSDIINIIERDNEFHVQLDKTYFYPEGGGQPSDTGLIETSNVTYVYENEGIVYHVVDKKPIKLRKVKCSIHWDRRFDHMQQHLGQHILSAAILESHNANTTAFHLGSQNCTLDLDKQLTELEIREAERLANKIISQNITVEFLFPSKSELKKLHIKKVLPKTNEAIRIVKIEDVDINPCCGLHPRSTLEVQIIKIKKFEKHKSGTRLEFLCGYRGIKDSFIIEEFATKLCKALQCNHEEALENILKQSANIKSLSSENRELKSTIADFEVKTMIDNAEKVNDISVIKNIYNTDDFKYANLLASKLTTFDNVVVLFAVKNNDMAKLLFMCSKNINRLDMNILLKDAITLIDGKGGGSNISAQGGGKNISNLQSCIDYAFMNIKNTLTL